MGCGPSSYLYGETDGSGNEWPFVDEKGFVSPLASTAHNRNTAFQAVVNGRAIWKGATHNKPTERTKDGTWKRQSGSTEPKRPGGGGGKEPSAAELKVMLILLENVKIKDGKVNQAAESDIMERVESPFNRQNMIDIAKNNSSKAAAAVKILRILFEIDSAKKCFTAAEKREVKTIFQREGGVTRRLKKR